MSVSYNSLTVGDPNPIKRRLHERRLSQAVKRMGIFNGRTSVLDFGAGDGELAHHILISHPDARVTVYEPVPTYMAEARDNLKKHGPRVNFAPTIDEIEQKFP